MNRIPKLLTLLDKMKKENICLVLVYINEAHTTKWPIGLNHPDPQADLPDRIERAKSFSKLYPQFDIYIDTWNNDFENAFQAWPDKYYFINGNLTILEKAEYGMNAIVLHDYSELLKEILK